MARDRADIGTEAAAGIRDRVVADTIPLHFRERRIGHLEQADGAGGRPVDRKRIEAEAPAPIGAVDRIARTLVLRQRGQQFRRDRAGGIGAKQRPVLPPRLGRLLVQAVADQEEQLGGLVDHLIEEVGEGEGHKQGGRDARDPNRARRAREFSSYPPYIPPSGEGGGGWTWVFLTWGLGGSDVCVGEVQPDDIAANARLHAGRASS